MKKQSGNALFLILIAIFLLGGLMVLLTRTGSQSDDTGDTEQRSIQSSQIIRYGASLKTAVDSLRSRGCSETQISFWSKDTNASGGENAGDDNYNANAPTDGSCHVFKPQGAGLKFKERTDFFPNGLWGTSGSLVAMSHNNFSANHAIPGVGAFSDGTNKGTELYWGFELPYNIDRVALCTAINKGLGYSDPTPPIAAVNVSTSFTGTYGGGTVATATEFTGKQAYCFSLTSDTQRHIFYYVLIAR